jgi:hypothetical protein
MGTGCCGKMCVVINTHCTQVLDALLEIAFQPAFLPMRIEKERKAVTAEAQVCVCVCVCVGV